MLGQKRSTTDDLSVGGQTKSKSRQPRTQINSKAAKTHLATVLEMRVADPLTTQKTREAVKPASSFNTKTTALNSSTVCLYNRPESDTGTHFMLSS